MNLPKQAKPITTEDRKKAMIEAIKLAMRSGNPAEAIARIAGRGGCAGGG